MKKSYITGIAVILAAAIIAGAAGMNFYAKRHFVEDIRQGAGVTEVFKLSRYNENLAGTIADTDVYVLKGEKEGGSLLLLGGTHPSEPAGHMAAIVFEENVKVEQGTVYVIPNINNSAFKIGRAHV